MLHHTSHKVFLQVVYNLAVVADDGVPVEEDGHLLPQVQPHEPRLLVLLQRQAHIPLLADQTLLVDDQTYLRLQKQLWLMQERRAVSLDDRICTQQIITT